MFSDSILVSADSEKRWVIEMEKNFPAAVDTDLDTRCCVFKVPQSVSETNPEAYAPRKIGLGPYHHLRPELYTLTQRQKLAVVRRGMNEQQLSRVHEVVEALLESDAAVRACYDHYIDLDATTLSWILAIDGIFFLRYLSTSTEMDDVVGDVIMLENQIPFLVLNKIKSLLLGGDDGGGGGGGGGGDDDDGGGGDGGIGGDDDGGGTGGGDGDDGGGGGGGEEGRILRVQARMSGPDDVDVEDFFQKKLYNFCEANSPLDVVIPFVYDINGLCSQSHHLLHCLYDLIVSNRGFRFVNYAATFSDVQAFAQAADDKGVPGAKTIVNVVSFMENAPWERIFGLFKRGHNKQLPLVDNIDVPTVSQMAKFVGITFISTQGGIRDVLFNEEAKKFSLPIITFKPHSEIFLRNLVAYEAASAKPGARLELAQYVDLMCGIIDTTKDVEILKKAKIIRGDNRMSDAEIVRVCNGIKRSTGYGGEARSNIEQAIQNVNKLYHGVWRVKLRKCLKKWFTVSWKVVCAAVAVAVTLLLTVQAFCNAFGCSSWFETTVQDFPSLYSYAT